MKRTTVYLPDDIHRALRREALDRDLTMAEVIRRVSEFYLKRNELFWQTVDRLQKQNQSREPASAEAEIARAALQVRRAVRAKKRAA
ncbi:MAG: ribbon-helix-helix protein, CopG family [Candidatus Wallbacteria bacterium]|nr:ribbon-helix-helix protein, CopG family [Candidatus Wallbacteria bacterium]